MKFLLLAALVAVAVAESKTGLVVPIAGGPVPAPDPEESFHPIAIGPAIIDSFEPIAIGPAVVGTPAVPSSSNPLVQIILNINTANVPVDPVGVVQPAPIRPEPVQVVETVPVPVEPVIIGTPILPTPAVILPEPLN